MGGGHGLGHPDHARAMRLSDRDFSCGGGSQPHNVVDAPGGLAVAMQSPHLRLTRGRACVDPKARAPASCLAHADPPVTIPLSPC